MTLCSHVATNNKYWFTNTANVYRVFALRHEIIIVNLIGKIHEVMSMKFSAQEFTSNKY